MALPLASLGAGALLGVSLAAPPGPVTALMLREAASRGPWRAVRVGLGATAADACYLALAAAGAIVVLAERPGLTGALALGGAVLLLHYAHGAWRAARRAGQEPAQAAQGTGPGAPAAAAGAAGEQPATFASGFLAAATSPFNLAWWLGPGTVLLDAQGPWLAAGMFAGIVGWVLLFSHGAGRLGARVPGFQRGASLGSAAILAGFAAWVAWHGLGLLGLLGPRALAGPA